MKILFFIPRMGGGGAERVVSLLANALVNKENNVTIYTMVGGDSFYELDSKIQYDSIGISVNRKNHLTALMSEIKYFFKTLFAINKKIRIGEYDIVISMLPECDILVGLCKFFGAKFRHICSERNDPNKRNKLYLAILKSIYKKSALFVCQGQRVYDFYSEVPEENKVIIPNFIDGDSLPERKAPSERRIVGVGRLNPQKNFSLLIDSFAAIDNQYSDYSLYIYGEGPERNILQQKINALHMQNRIKLCGAKRNVLELISDADLFVMSSDYEGFPNALLEAMAIGLPVISTDFPTGIAVDLIDEKSGIVVPTGDRVALAEAIENMLSNETLRQQMGKYNHELCKKYYTANIITKWEKAIERVLLK